MTLSAIFEGKNARLKRGQHVLFFQEDPITGDITESTIVKLSEDSKIITDEGGQQ